MCKFIKSNERNISSLSFEDVFLLLQVSKLDFISIPKLSRKIVSLWISSCKRIKAHCRISETSFIGNLWSLSTKNYPSKSRNGCEISERIHQYRKSLSSTSLSSTYDNICRTGEKFHLESFLRSDCYFFGHLQLSGIKIWTGFSASPLSVVSCLSLKSGSVLLRYSIAALRSPFIPAWISVFLQLSFG